jgi:hypothetical protein
MRHEEWLGDSVGGSILDSVRTIVWESMWIHVVDHVSVTERAYVIDSMREYVQGPVLNSVAGSIKESL